jgi:hypothetical protein
MKTATTVSLASIRDQVRETALKSYLHPGWWTVRVAPNGDVYESHEASACYSESEYFRQEPHVVTVWASGTGTGCLTQEEVDNEAENGDWEAWFEYNLPELDLIAKLAPTGLEITE